MKCAKCNAEITNNSPYCGKCGAKVEEQFKFCGGCGAKLSLDSKFCGTCGMILNDVPTQSVNTSVINDNNNLMAFFSKISSKVKPFLFKYKLPLIIVTVIIVLALAGWYCFQNFYDFTKLSWVENYGDYASTHVKGGALELKVEAYDKEDELITNIKFSVDGGEVNVSGPKVEWILPEQEGKYTITAEAPSGKRITKDIEIINTNFEEELTNGIIPVEIEKDENYDSDQDGLTDAEEKKLGTDINEADTDHDGLIDSIEVNTTKTDPLKKDTDGDSLYDGVEIDLELNPLKKDSKDDGIIDSDRELTYEVKDDNVTLKTTGRGNISLTTVDTSINTTFEKTEGVYPVVYDLHTDGSLTSAELVIQYSDEELAKYDVKDDNIALYYFDEKTKKLEKVNAIIDREKNTITATLTHFSKYILADETKVKLTADTQLMFIIDNSVSMYSEQQMIDAGYNDSVGAIGNDTEFKRLQLTNELVDMFTGNYKFGVAEFSGNYVNLKEFSDDKKEVKEAVKKMESHWNSDADGTDIIEALQKGLAEFSNDENNHYIVLLTDGKNTEGNLLKYQDPIIEEAKSKNVRICVIGLGTDIDTNELDEIAEETGCDYYHASNSSALDEIYSIMGAEINYNLVDTDNDGEVDSTIVADSGFITTRDGFSFNNFATNNSEGGHCYGMATFAMLYYTDKLPIELNDINEIGLYKHGFWFNKKAAGYNLKNTYFFNEYSTPTNANLYDYQIKNEGLKYYLKAPEDYRNRIENKIYMINDDYKKAMEAIGITISTNDYNAEEFNKYESALLDVSSNKFKNNVSGEEQQLMNAIYRLFVLQADDKALSFSTSPDDSYEYLESQLQNGVPIVLNVGGSHAVNAIRLLRNNEDPNEFKIEIYDNNYPGKTLYIEGTRFKMNKSLSVTTWFNDYDYEFKYNDEEISLGIHIPTVK